MKTYLESPKEIPISEEVDVLVLGSGPAGVAAAISAARCGVKTMIIESCGTVGGIATAGLMSHWTGSCNSNIYHEILKRSAERNENLGEKFEFHNQITKYIDPEKLKTLLIEMLCEAGVIIKLYTFASDVIMEDNGVKGVILESKSGRHAVMAKVVIDATGDGDIAAKAGAEHIVGREEDGKMQPVTSMFKVGGVDYSRAVFLNSFESTYETAKGELQALGKEHIPFPAGHVLLYPSTLPGIVTCNMTNVLGVDGRNAEDLTKAEIECRKQMDIIIRFLREFAPGYENCYIISSAALIGVRETRHFKGMYTITKEDILEAKVFEDWITRDAKFNFDVHNITGAGLDETGVQKHFTQKKGYTIPYGCLVPVKINNLLLAGRNISGTHMAHSNYRAMPICVGTGEGAGIAAAIAVQQNVLVRNVNAKDIQNKIISNETKA